MDGESEIARDLTECGDKEIAEVVALRALAGTETVRKKAGQQIAFFAQGYHAVAQVAGWEHVEVLAQPAGRASVIGHGDHCGQIADPFSPRGDLTRRGRVGGPRIVENYAVELFPRLFVVTLVQLRDSVVIALFRSMKSEMGMVQLPAARGDIHPGSLQDLSGRDRQ